MCGQINILIELRPLPIDMARYAMHSISFSFYMPRPALANTLLSHPCSSKHFLLLLYPGPLSFSAVLADKHR